MSVGAFSVSDTWLTTVVLTLDLFSVTLSELFVIGVVMFVLSDNDCKYVKFTGNSSKKSSVLCNDVLPSDVINIYLAWRCWANAIILS